MENINVLQFIQQNWVAFLGLQLIICAIVLKIYIELSERAIAKKTLVRFEVLFSDNKKDAWIDKIKYKLGIDGASITKSVGCSVGWKTDINPVQARILLIMVLRKQLETELPHLSIKDWLELADNLQNKMEENAEEALLSLEEPSLEAVSKFVGDEETAIKIIKLSERLEEHSLSQEDINLILDMLKDEKNFEKSVDKDKKL